MRGCETLIETHICPRKLKAEDRMYLGTVRKTSKIAPYGSDNLSYRNFLELHIFRRFFLKLKGCRLIYY